MASYARPPADEVGLGGDAGRRAAGVSAPAARPRAVAEPERTVGLRDRRDERHARAEVATRIGGGRRGPVRRAAASVARAIRPADPRAVRAGGGAVGGGTARG